MEDTNQDDKVINFSDTTGILMNSVKTIVNAVSYVLIAFVSRPIAQLKIFIIHQKLMKYINILKKIETPIPIIYRLYNK